MYDLIQGRREADIFSQGNVDNRPRTLAEAIKEVLKIDYNGKTGSNIVGVGSETGIERRRGSTGDVERGGRGTEGERAADGKGRAKGDAGEEGVAPFQKDCKMLSLRPKPSLQRRRRRLETTRRDIFPSVAMTSPQRHRRA